jgi:hypothetical protein
VDYFLGLAGALIALAFVAAGALYVHYGLRTWKLDHVAIESLAVMLPVFVAYALVIASMLLVGSDLLPGDTPGLEAMWQTQPDGAWLWHAGGAVTYVLTIMPWAVWNGGQVAIIRGRPDVVHRGLQAILRGRNLPFTRDGDSYSVPSARLTVRVSVGRFSEFVYVRTRPRRSREGVVVQGDLLALFRGVESAGTHPSWVATGCVVAIFGAALGVAFALA